MKTTVKIFVLIALSAIASFAQKPKTPIVKPAAQTTIKTAPPSTPKAVLEEGKLVGKTYTNKTFDFEIKFPDAWLVPDKNFEAEMLKQGYDLRLKTPPTLTVLQTAYKFIPEKTDNAVIRIAVEDLKANPQIKDAVDYFDAMRKSFKTVKTVKTPADFKYSETQAERLGAKQFAYLDSSSKETGKKRIYAIVRDGYAIMFVMTYTDDADIEILRSILMQADFKLNK